MSLISQGSWAIESVRVNSGTVVDFDGFDRLQISSDYIAISPIGLSFRIGELTQKGLRLSSDGETYYANFCLERDSIELSLRRPEMDDTILLRANSDGTHSKKAK